MARPLFSYINLRYRARQPFQSFTGVHRFPIRRRTLRRAASVQCGVGNEEEVSENAQYRLLIYHFYS